MQFSGKGILLDIEGTTSSIRFVYDEMFPFARRELENYLVSHWEDPGLGDARELMAADAGFENWASWCKANEVVEDDEGARGLVRNEANRLMDGDVKATGLKQLQGLIWKAGFDSGELKAHLYDEVAATIKGWAECQLDVRIYSSGSIAAQKLFFGHTICGNLLSLLNGHYDTTIGAKKEAASYLKIAADFDMPPSEILFLSDVVAELDAAREAGYMTCLSVRPGNPEAGEHSHPAIKSFDEITIEV